MNKKLGILNVFTFIVILLIISFDVEAATRKSVSSSTKDNGASTTERKLSPQQKNTICKNYLGMDIDIKEYNRKSDYKNGRYTDIVGERDITVKAKKGTGNYLVQVYVAPVGKLEKIEDLSDAIKAKASRLDSGDIDDTFDDLEDKDEDVMYFEKNFSTASDNSKVVYKLPPGYEALVIMLNNKKKNSGEYGTGDVLTKDSNGKATSWKKYDVTCPSGKFKKATSNSSELDIDGNAVSMYSQNPEEDTFVTNYGKSDIKGTACYNAKYGIYDGSQAEQKKYNIQNVSLNETWNKMYTKVLGEKYCEQSSVSFYLDNDKIKEISNKLLISYYYINKLKQSSSKTYDEVNRIIHGVNLDDGDDSLIKQVDKVYKNTESKKSNLNLLVDCNYGMDYKTNHFKTFLVYEENSESAEIFNGKVTTKGKVKKSAVDICKTICYEKLTVDYSPPVTVKAGLCFQYKVTVKSKVECGVDAGENVILEKMQLRKTCNPEPICSNKESATQGGPNQQFDTCIKECDNGNYSQKCINKCYNKVYKKKSENNNSNNKKVLSKSNKNTNNQSIDTMELNSKMIKSNGTVEKISVNNGYEFKDLDNYWKEDTAKSVKYKKDGSNFTVNCSTENLISYVDDDSPKLDVCAEYFTQAKILNPKGNYLYNSKDKFSWETEFDKYKAETSDKNIVKQLGVASPFYLRSVESTKKLIKDLVCPKGVSGTTARCTKKASATGRYRKYSIMGSNSDYTGIKKQYSARFQCDEECHFTGCEATDALTSSDYTKTIIDDLDEINSKLAKCGSTTACDKGEEKQTTFNIDVKTNLTNGASNESLKDGTTESGNGTTDDKTNPIGGEKNMFVPADSDKNTNTGILGKCYDANNQIIDYQTTITFPGSWINLKTGEVYYEEKPTDTNREKKYYYCSPYNAKDVNKKWFIWSVYENSDATKYPKDFSPEEWNITANLGDTSGNKKFGKYNWSIGFSCFYASYNKTVNTDDVKCYKNDDGSDANCPTNEEKSTRLQDSYDIRVSSNKSIFPQKNGQDRLRGYNWGSQAKLESKDATIQNALENTGYGVDPVKYSTKVMEKGQKVYDDTAEVTITLSQSQMDALKKESLEFSGAYNNKVKDIPGLYYYTMNNTFKTAYGINTNWTLGNNSKTAKEAIR